MKTLLKALVFLLLLASAIVAAAWYWFTQHAATKSLRMTQDTVQVKIDRGMSLRSVASRLRQQGVDVTNWELEAGARLRGDAQKIKSGTYQLKRPLTLNGLLDKLVSGETIAFEVRLIEGWTFKQFRAALANEARLEQKTRDWSDQQLLEAVGSNAKHPEGLFFPDTYKFAPGQSDLDILKRAYREMQSRLTKAWEARPADSPLKTPYELLTLASIIEKETGLEADRAKVAAVFINRLRIGMRLQTDPTVIYGMGDQFKGNIRRKDLETDTPYNTYTRDGLPPTPIAMPGQNSLKAAIEPANIKALYFVARGDGTSEFSDDLSAHNRAVDRYQRKQK